MKETGKFRDGAFVLTTFEPDPTNIKEVIDFRRIGLNAMTPMGRIAGLWEMANLIEIEVPELDEAEQMLREPGGIKSTKRHMMFNDLLRQAEIRIQKEGHYKIEEALSPLAKRGEKNLCGTSNGGKNSHSLTEEERKARNVKIQEEVNRLCLVQELSYNSAMVRVAEDFKLHRDTIKKITFNPKK